MEGNFNFQAEFYKKNHIDNIFVSDLSQKNLTLVHEAFIFISLNLSHQSRMVR